MGLFGKKKTSESNSGVTSVTLENGESISLISTVDCIGDSCPRPQLMAKNELGKRAAGDVIAISVDNPTSMEALPSIIAENGGEHIETIREDRHWKVVARKL